MKTRKHLLFAAYCLVFSVFLAACMQNAAGARSRIVLGTVCSIDLYENRSDDLYNRLFSRLEELELIFSANRDDSELAKVNQNAGLLAVDISPELFAVLERALYFADVSGGAFDPTVGPLIKLWEIGMDNPRIPSDEEIDAALDLVNYMDLELTRRDNGGSAFLKRQGMALDLGGIAKGYAADELTKILKETGTKRALIDLGGNIYIWGRKPNGEPWRIGIQEPWSNRGSYAGILALKDSISVVSSGVYERFFTGNDGKNYHHIMELTGNEGRKRGYPVENGILSATIIASSSMDADALSTVCFILGYEKGLALASAEGAEIVFIMEGNAIIGSPGAMAIFTPADDK